MNTSEEKVKQILEVYKQTVENTKEALRIAQVPESLVIYYTINLPDFNMMIPDDIVKFYQDIRKLVILHLNKIGLSRGEIAKKIGKNQYLLIGEILKQENRNVEAESK